MQLLTVGDKVWYPANGNSDRVDQYAEIVNVDSSDAIQTYRVKYNVVRSAYVGDSETERRHWAYNTNLDFTKVIKSGTDKIVNATVPEFITLEVGDKVWMQAGHYDSQWAEITQVDTSDRYQPYKVSFRTRDGDMSVRWPVLSTQLDLTMVIKKETLVPVPPVPNDVGITNMKDWLRDNISNGMIGNTEHEAKIAVVVDLLRKSGVTVNIKTTRRDVEFQ